MRRQLLLVAVALMYPTSTLGLFGGLDFPEQSQQSNGFVRPLPWNNQPKGKGGPPAKGGTAKGIFFPHRPPPPPKPERPDIFVKYVPRYSKSIKSSKDYKSGKRSGYYGGDVPVYKGKGIIISKGKGIIFWKGKGKGKGVISPTLSPISTVQPTRRPSTRPISAAPTRVFPTVAPITSSPSVRPITSSPTARPLTASPTTFSPTVVPDTSVPTEGPITANPTTAQPTNSPTSDPATSAPTSVPETSAPTTVPETSAPTTIPSTAVPTAVPATAAPTTVPATSAPTTVPVSSAPTTGTSSPTTVPGTSQPTTLAPTTQTDAPSVPTSLAPTTQTGMPTTNQPTQAPNTDAPSQATTDVPTLVNATETPTATLVPTATLAPTTQNPTSLPTATSLPTTSAAPSASVQPSGSVRPTASIQPSLAPVADKVDTSQPTLSSEAPSLSISPTEVSRIITATPFSITYLLNGPEPTDFQFDSAAAITLRFLDQFLGELYANDPDTTYTGSTGFPISTIPDPAEIEYEFTAVFGEDSTFVPSVGDLDAAIQTALVAPAVNDLIATLNLLPASNPFSTTFAIEYNELNIIVPFTRRPTTPLPLTRRPTTPGAHSKFVGPSTAPMSQPVADKESGLKIAQSDPVENDKNDDGKSSAVLIVVIVIGILLGLVGLGLLEMRRMRRIRETGWGKQPGQGANNNDDESSNLMSFGEESVNSDYRGLVPTWTNPDGIDSGAAPTWSRSYHEANDSRANNTSYSSSPYEENSLLTATMSSEKASSTHSEDEGSESLLGEDSVSGEE